MQLFPYLFYALFINSKDDWTFSAPSLSGALTVLDYLYNSLASLPVNLLLSIDNVEATLYWLHYTNTTQIIDLAVTLAIAEE